MNEHIQEDMEPHVHLIEQLISRSTPRPTLYHYTNAAGVFGIATEHMLWATDYRFLNDTYEFQYAVRSYRRALEERRSDPNDKYPAIWDEWRECLDLAGRARVFVVSFCEDGDLLSQWRAYGTVTGYALGFRGEAINSLCLNLPDAAVLLKCVYDRSEQDHIINKALDHLVLRLSETFARFPESGTEIVYHFGRHFLGQLLVTAAMFKHPQFVEEREWRFIVRAASPDKPDTVVKYRTVRDHIVPYIEVPFTRDTLGGLVEDVIAGPHPHGNAAGLSVHELFESEGFGNVPVRISDIPYRNW